MPSKETRRRESVRRSPASPGSSPIRRTYIHRTFVAPAVWLAERFRTSNHTMSAINLVLRVRLIITAHFSRPCETARKHANAGEHDPCLCTGDCLLEILGEATTSVEPGQGPFNHPAFRLGLESADTLRSCDDLNGPRPQLGDGVEQFVAAVDPVGEDMPQPGERVAELLQQRHRAMIVLDIGWVHLQDKQRTDRIGDDVTFASHHFLSHIKPAWTATFRRFHTLAIDDAGRRGSLAPLCQARALDQDPIDPRPDPPVAPIVEIMLNRCEGRKVFRQGTPLAAGRKNVEDRIHDRAKVHLARTPDPARLRQQRAQQYPLLRCCVACIAKPFAAIYFAGGFGPCHVVPLVESQTRRNHNRAGITRLIFGQPLRTRLMGAIDMIRTMETLY